MVNTESLIRATRLIFGIAGRTVGLFFTGLTILILFAYALAGRYEFPDPRPFSGNHLWNPYENIGGNWLRCNFHVASASWGGLTHGQDSAEAVDAKYRSLGYDIISISNYQRINPYRADQPDYVPNYEHGVNVRKRHHLLIGAERVVWYDLPLGQNVHQKQEVINRTRPHTGFLALAHPVWNGAYTSEDMAKLTGFDGLEILNFYRISISLWDDALSAGRRIVGVGNDDSHDINNPEETGLYWTMVDAPEANGELAVEGLKAGRAYAVMGKGGANNLAFRSLRVEGQKIIVEFDRVAEKIRFIGQGGAHRAIVEDTAVAEYTFQPDDTYIRVEARGGGTTLFLNPVFRWDGKSFQEFEARPLPLTSWLFRLPFITTLVLYLGFLFRSPIRRFLPNGAVGRRRALIFRRPLSDAN